MDLKKVRVDRSKIDEGVRVHWIDDVYFQVSKTGSPRWRKAFMDVMQRTLKETAIDLSETDDEDRLAAQLKFWEDVGVEALAKGCILGWEGLMEDDVVIPYSSEKAHELLLDNTLPDTSDGLSLLDVITISATDESAYLLYNMEEIVKK